MRILLIVLTLINLWWVNNRELIIYPSTYKAKAPSVWLKESPQIRWLMANARVDSKISGLDFPFYCGHWVKLRTLGYMGGFRTKKLGDYLGKEGTNVWTRSEEEAERYGIRYFIREGKVFEVSTKAQVY